MALGFKLPAFARGVASAQELNKLTMAHEYVQNAGAFNYAWPQMGEGMDAARYILHRHRYLHWYCYAGNSELFLNGSKVDECSPGELYGVVDLATLNLPDNKIYKLHWDNGPGSDPDELKVQCIHLMEHPAQTFGISYPHSIPNFANGTTLTSADLNRLANNTQYLLDYYISGQGCGFTRVAEETLNEYGGPGEYRQEWHYWIRHEHRYLYVATDRRALGEPGATRRIKLLINDTAYYQDTDTYVVWWPHAVALDLSGAGDHYAYQGDNTPTNAPTIGKGNWYKLTIFMSTEGEDLTQDECFIHIAGEMPVRDWI